MKKTLLLLIIAQILSATTEAAETDWDQVDNAIQKKAIIIDGVRKYSLPRSDLHVTLDGVSIKPAFALGGWIAFDKSEHQAMMMGDLVLSDTEIAPVMRSLIDGGVYVTAIHNHLLRLTPSVFYMHIGGHGDPIKLAKAVRDALALTATPFIAPASAPGESLKFDFDTAQVDAILQSMGKNNGGVYQYSIPRSDPIKADGVALSSAMGGANVINFQSTGDGNAAVTGDFIAKSEEVPKLLKAFQSGMISVTAIHNHMLNEEPRAFFIHFWANSNAINLAKALRAALDVVKRE